MKIGDKVYIRGTIDEIRKDVVIIRNKGGYFGTVPEEIQTNIGDFSEQLWLNSRNRAFDEVLEIIDTQLEALADGKCGGASALSNVYEAVLGLRGEQG